MKYKIVYLADHREFVPVCASWAFRTWGKYNLSYTLEKRVESFTQHCNKEELPLTIVALSQTAKPIGMASLRSNDGIRPDLSPWLGSVYVDLPFRGRGVAASLVRETHNIGHKLGFKILYLLSYESTLPQWYAKLGWNEIGVDNCHGNPVNVMQIELDRYVQP
ncbi:MAG: GNAT family N-acetyltransferase [Cyanobacteriota/Melainabacteria group bacterium]